MNELLELAIEDGHFDHKYFFKNIDYIQKFIALIITLILAYFTFLLLTNLQTKPEIYKIEKVSKSFYKSFKMIQKINEIEKVIFEKYKENNKNHQSKITILKKDFDINGNTIENYYKNSIKNIEDNSNNIIEFYQGYCNKKSDKENCKTALALDYKNKLQKYKEDYKEFIDIKLMIKSEYNSFNE